MERKKIQCLGTFELVRAHTRLVKGVCALGRSCKFAWRTLLPHIVHWLRLGRPAKRDCGKRRERETWGRREQERESMRVRRDAKLRKYTRSPTYAGPVFCKSLRDCTYKYKYIYQRIYAHMNESIESENGAQPEMNHLKNCQFSGQRERERGKKEEQGEKGGAGISVAYDYRGRVDPGAKQGSRRGQEDLFFLQFFLSIFFSSRRTNRTDDERCMTSWRVRLRVTRACK